MLQRKLKQDKFELCLNLHFLNEKDAGIASKAILPDVSARHLKRSSISLSIKNTIISINIKAQDAIAMRASLNGCLNSIILAKNVMEV